MAGELTASTPVIAKTTTEIKAAIDALTLAAVTDKVAVGYIGEGQFYIFKVERAA